MSCKKCGFQSETFDRFCIECGTSLNNKCEHCGTELPVTAKFCRGCGDPQSFPEPVDVNQNWESVQEPEVPLSSGESEDVNGQSIDAKKQIDKEDITAFIDGLIGRAITLYNDGYESAFVGVVEFAPAESEFIALYDWNKCVEILAYDLGYDWNTEEAFQAEDTLSYGLRTHLFRETDPVFLEWWNSDDEGISYLDGYKDAFVGLISAAPLSAETVALYDWSKCVEILASNLDEENKSQAEGTLSRTTRRALFRETDPAFLFRFPGFVTSEELHELYGDYPSLLDWSTRGGNDNEN